MTTSGIWGHAPPELWGVWDTLPRIKKEKGKKIALRLILRHSGWTSSLF